MKRRLSWYPQITPTLILTLILILILTPILILTLINQFAFQKYGVKSTKMVNNSKRPSNMKKARNSFTSSDSQAKLSTGPTLPMAGPTLPKEVATAPMAVIKSSPIAASTIEPSTNRER